MSKSVTHNDMKAAGIKVRAVPFEFTTANTSDPTGVIGKGVASIVRNGAAGRFLITLRDQYRRLTGFKANAIGTTVYVITPYAVSNENTANAVTVEVGVYNTSFSLTDTSSVRIVGQLTFEDSDA